MSTFAVIMPAAGKSSRFKDQHYKKPFAMLNDRAVWLHAAEKFFNRDDVKQFILVLAEEDREEFQMKFGANVMIHGVQIVMGGKERADSIQNAIEKLRDDVKYVAIHDAARPCIANEWIDAVFSEATKTGAAILAVPVAGTLKRSADGKTIDETFPRDKLWEAQTPQVFRRDLLLKAYAARKGLNATDDAQLVEQIGHPVSIVPGSPINFKITTKEDLRLASQAIKALPKPRLDGPAHPFADDRWR